jgi:hypothetical protein
MESKKTGMKISGKDPLKWPIPLIFKRVWPERPNLWEKRGC